MLAGLDAAAGGTVLELGCGTGRNLVLRRAALSDAALLRPRHLRGDAGDGAQADLAREAIAAAQRSWRRATRPISTRLALFGRQRFDRVFISYALSMIPGWEKTIELALQSLAPGGALHIVDFGRQEQLPGWFRGMLRAWLARFSVTPIADFEPEIARLAQLRGFTSRVSRPYRGYAIRAVLAGNGAFELLDELLAGIRCTLRSSPCPRAYFWPGKHLIGGRLDPQGAICFLAAGPRSYFAPPPVPTEDPHADHQQRRRHAGRGRRLAPRHPREPRDPLRRAPHGRRGRRQAQGVRLRRGGARHRPDRRGRRHQGPQGRVGQGDRHARRHGCAAHDRDDRPALRLQDARAHARLRPRRAHRHAAGGRQVSVPRRATSTAPRSSSSSRPRRAAPAARRWWRTG